MLTYIGNRFFTTRFASEKDSTWLQFIRQPEQYGFKRKYPFKGCTTYLLYKKINLFQRIKYYHFLPYYAKDNTYNRSYCRIWGGSRWSFCTETVGIQSLQAEGQERAKKFNSRFVCKIRGAVEITYPYILTSEI